MNSFKLVFREHKDNLQNIWQMAIKDLRKKYAGTVLSYTWSVISNLIYVFAYWFTISVGLKGEGKVGYPYMAWLVSGLGAWFFIKDVLFPASTSIRKNKYLVTKMVYPISIIPTFKVISSYMSSLMFLPIIFFILIISGIKVDIHWVQVIYYQFAAIALLVGISWLTSAIVVISRDVEMLINSTIILLFWVTPILFPVSNLKGNLAFIVKLNPLFYIVEGFRGSFLYGEWFWEHPALTLYFWSFVAISMLIGAFVHGRLRNQFADVL